MPFARLHTPKGEGYIADLAEIASVWLGEDVGFSFLSPSDDRWFSYHGRKLLAVPMIAADDYCHLFLYRHLSVAQRPVVSGEG